MWLDDFGRHLGHTREADLVDFVLDERNVRALDHFGFGQFRRATNAASSSQSNEPRSAEQASNGLTAVHFGFVLLGSGGFKPPSYNR